MAAPALVERAKLRVGTVLREKWRLDALLGVGGSAAVYSSTHRNGKRAAIKLLHQELAVEPDVVNRFLREGYVANKIDHPGAVAIIDDDKTDAGEVFLIMELLEGMTLERKLRKEGARPVQEALRLTEELLEVLQTAHEKGIIHRDIKPANIFLTKKGPLKVLDYGIARLAETSQLVNATLAGMPLGTPAFMPPEQARGRWNEVDPRTDVWAVGAVLWAMLVGQRPRKAETSNEELLLAMTQPIPLIRTVAPHVSAEVMKLVDRAVSFEMDARWPSARTMQQAARLALLLEQASGSPRDSKAPPTDVVRSIPAMREPMGRVMDTLEDPIRPTHFTPSDAQMLALSSSRTDALRRAAPAVSASSSGLRAADAPSSLTPSGIHADGILTTGRPITSTSEHIPVKRPRRMAGYVALLAILGILGGGAYYFRDKVVPRHVEAAPSAPPHVEVTPPPPAPTPPAITVPAPTPPAVDSAQFELPETHAAPPTTGTGAVPAPSASAQARPPRSPAPKGATPPPKPAPASAAPPAASDRFGF